MSYTATKYFTPFPYAYPAGHDNTQRTTDIYGIMADCDTATYYTPGGIGSTSFEVTAFSAVGLVTYSSLKGQQLVNGQRVVIYNTSSNTNDGTYVVSAISASSTSAGTFTAVPIGINTLSGTAQTGQTAEGVGQIQFGNRAVISQTFTASAVSVSKNVMTVTYTTFTGPQLQAGQKVTLTGMTNSGNNGTFTLNSATPTSSTGGSFAITNASAVSTDSGTGTATVQPGSGDASAGGVPIVVWVESTKGWVYEWDQTNYTIRAFGGSSSGALTEAALGANVTFDTTVVFEAIFPRWVDVA